MNAEYFDIVDGQDRVIGQSTRDEVHRLGLLHRAVHIIVRNTREEIILQKRSLSKDTSPGKWTTSCSGHVDAGESYDTAAVRELGEELGIYIKDIAACSLLFKHPPCDATGQEFIQVYELVHDGPYHAPESEVSELRYMQAAALTTWMQEEPSAFAPSFHLVWKRYRHI